MNNLIIFLVKLLYNVPILGQYVEVDHEYRGRLFVLCYTENYKFWKYYTEIEIGMELSQLLYNRDFT